MKMRTVHHLSCSGGTVISKCIAAMNDVFLLSELHPYRIGSLIFNPFDPLQQLIVRTDLRENIDFQRKIFLDRVRVAEKSLRKMQKHLVIRDHTHTDYLDHSDPSSISSKKSLIDALSYDYRTISVLTIRNPIDSYSSLIENGWNKKIKSFDDYCYRVGLMIEEYSKSGIPIYKYEDFCKNPDKIMQLICNDLEIEYACDYRQTFNSVKLTGDSGRSSKSLEISSLPARERSERLLAGARKSQNFAKICEQLGYSI